METLIPNDNISNNFASKLKDSNYKETLNSNKKKIYENSDYKVIIRMNLLI